MSMTKVQMLKLADEIGSLSGRCSLEADREACIKAASMIRAAAQPQASRESVIEECASVEVRGDIETEAAATNAFQEGYAVGYQDTVHRFRAAIRALANPPAMCQSGDQRS